MSTHIPTHRTSIRISVLQSFRMTSGALKSGRTQDLQTAVWLPRPQFRVAASRALMPMWNTIKHKRASENSNFPSRPAKGTIVPRRMPPKRCVRADRSVMKQLLSSQQRYTSYYETSPRGGGHVRGPASTSVGMYSAVDVLDCAAVVFLSPAPMHSPQREL